MPTKCRMLTSFSSSQSLIMGIRAGSRSTTTPSSTLARRRRDPFPFGRHVQLREVARVGDDDQDAEWTAHEKERGSGRNVEEPDDRGALHLGQVRADVRVVQELPAAWREPEPRSDPGGGEGSCPPFSFASDWRTGPCRPRRRRRFRRADCRTTGLPLPAPMPRSSPASSSRVERLQEPRQVAVVGGGRTRFPHLVPTESGSPPRDRRPGPCRATRRSKFSYARIGQCRPQPWLSSSDSFCEDCPPVPGL